MVSAVRAKCLKGSAANNIFVVRLDYETMPTEEAASDDADGEEAAFGI